MEEEMIKGRFFLWLAMLIWTISGAWLDWPRWAYFLGAALVFMLMVAELKE